MGKMTAAQLDATKNMAELVLRATGAIEQAGRGLAGAYDKCSTNTADAVTLGQLIVVQGYVNDAIKALHEAAYQGSCLLLELPDGD